MGQFFEDLRYALRRLRNAPRFTAAAILTLALGIGVSTASFTLFHGMLLKSLPVPEPKQLYRIGDTFNSGNYIGSPQSNGDFDLFSSSLYEHLRNATPEFQDLAATQSGTARFAVRRGQDPAKMLDVAYVSGSYFNTLGVSAHLGKVFSDADDSPAAPPMAVLSYEAWRSEFGGDQSIIGSTLLIQSHPVVIVGVAQRGFFGDRISETPPAIWIPLSSVQYIDEKESNRMRPEINWLWLVGRVRPGVDVALLQNKLSADLRQWLSTVPYYQRPEEKSGLPKQHVILVPAANGIQDMAEGYSAGLKLLMLLSFLVLLVACGNIANLMLVRGAARQPEISLRVALGAPRARILRQILTEGLLLSCFGGAAGIVLAWLGTYAILRLGFPEATAFPVQAAPSVPVLTFALLATALTGLLFSAAPARHSMLSQPVHAMRGYLHSTVRLSPLPQKILLVLQAALSLVLIGVAALAARSLHNLANQQLGFATENRYVMRFDDQSTGLTDDDRPELYRKIQAHLSKLGGVASVGLASFGPYEHAVMQGCVVVIGDAGKPGARTCGVNRNQINAQYLDTMGVPILQGRNFNDTDTAASLPVTVVNKAFATQVFANQNPLGKHVADESDPSHVLQIVGISGDVKIDAHLPVLASFYKPITQLLFPDNPFIIQSIVVHFRNQPEDPEGTIRRALAQVDPNLAISDPRPMDSQIAGTLGQERLIADLALIFAILAVILASIGLYGVTSYIAIQRTHEIAIRIALGSTRFGIIRFVLRAVMGQIGLGILLGIPLALTAGYQMKEQLYQLRWYDPAGLILAILVLALCSISAELIPARRAASIDPMKVLRTE